MSEQAAETQPKEHASKLVYTVILLLLAAFGLIYAAFVYADKEFQRDLHNWELRLGTTANIRADNVSDWLSEQLTELRNMSENMSLQLYMSEIILAEEDDNTVQDAQAEYTYLRNYINATAQRTGFAADPRPGNIRANIPASGASGIAVVDTEHSVLLASENMPPLTGMHREFLQKAHRDQNYHISQIYEGVNGQPSIAFYVPVYGIQTDPLPENVIGGIIGIRTLSNSLYPLLEYPETPTHTEETYLVSVQNNVAHYLSPLQDGTKPLFRKLTLDNQQLDARFVAENPNAFGYDARNYQGGRVLITGRLISQTPWYLIHTISWKEAMAESIERRNSLIVIAILLTTAILLTILVFWKHGISLRIAREAERYRKLAKQHESQGMLLELISQNQPDSMFILDEDNILRFANKATCRYMPVEPEDIIAKPIDNVMGPSKAEPYKSINKQLKGKGKQLIRINSRKEGDGLQHFFQTKYIPLAEIPSIIAEKEHSTGVLVVDQDISTAVDEREKREGALNNMINMLVEAIDLRDPYASHHSSRVAELAGAIAEAMELDEKTVRTTVKAAKLMNLGKMYLPQKLLTKKTKLNAKEKQEISESILKSADLIDGIDFDGPLAETLAQSLENWDGSGPLGLQGDDILLTSRIIRVANAFIAMVSPRAYREPLSKDEALDMMLEQVGTKYQRRIVAALINYLDDNKEAYERIAAEK